MTRKQKIKITTIIILINLIIGNAFLCSDDINYFLIIGMSLSCIFFYFAFFKYSGFENYNNFALFSVSVLSCMAIIFFGNTLALIIKEPFKDIFSKIPAMIAMGIMGNILLFPVSLAMGIINFTIIKYLIK